MMIMVISKINSKAGNLSKPAFIRIYSGDGNRQASRYPLDFPMWIAVKVYEKESERLNLFLRFSIPENNNRKAWHALELLDIDRIGK
jgi:hypothetical protein